MKKFYNTPAVLIKEYEISENITTSNIAPGGLDTNDDGFEDMSGVEAFVKIFGNDFDVKPHRGIPSLDINPKGISKATGMEDILKYLGRSREDTIAFGDASNDLEMIEYAGLGIAMGNASEDVKKRADRICKAVDEDGFYYACVELGLIDDLFTKNVI